MGIQTLRFLEGTKNSPSLPPLLPYVRLWNEDTETIGSVASSHNW